MRVIIFGATGKTGTQVMRVARERGHEVTAFVRPGRESSLEEAGVGVITGDVFDADAVRRAIEGQDAVLCALGSKSLRATTIRSEGTTNIISAMGAAEVDRLVVMSAMGVGESWSTLSWINRLFFATLLRASRNDHEAQERAVKQSENRWTIIRASGLTDGPETGQYELGEDVRGTTSRISRADVARAMLDALEDPSLERRAVTITN
jgi:putative NADH-flavin reductase